jgi:hypothetical protein
MRLADSRSSWRGLRGAIVLLAQEQRIVTAMAAEAVPEHFADVVLLVVDVEEEVVGEVEDEVAMWLERRGIKGQSRRGSTKKRTRAQKRIIIAEMRGLRRWLGVGWHLDLLDTLRIGVPMKIDEQLHRFAGGEL